jgi:nifR3 family TIM-barrel protein
MNAVSDASVKAEGNCESRVVSADAATIEEVRSQNLLSELAPGGAPIVVLAPMAGVTNAAFRSVCRQASAQIAPGFGAACYVSEMITSRGLVERNAKTMRMVAFGPDETYRSLQIFGVDPVVMGEAAAMIARENLADHIDINFGCPVPKVTRKGGGAALPWKTPLFRAIVESAVRNAVREDGSRLPVTVKMRVGIDDEHKTYLDAGIAAAEVGASWVALHGRTAQQFYGGHADWTPIGNLVTTLSSYGVPVLGNGDIWTAHDAVRMVEQTGCAGVVVGRGCLGRPWLFGQIAAGLAGAAVPAEPNLEIVLHWLRAHTVALIDHYRIHGAEDGERAFDPERTACSEMRKHMAWYLKGFAVGSTVRAGLGQIHSLADIDALLAQIDVDQQADLQVAAGPRGRTTPERPVALPEGWLNSRDIAYGFAMADAEMDVSGG